MRQFFKQPLISSQNRWAQNLDSCSQQLRSSRDIISTVTPVIIIETTYHTMKSLRLEKNYKHSRCFLQIKLISLECTQPPLNPITIKLYKGIQKLDEIKNPIECSQNHTQLQCSLDFYTNAEDAQRTSSYRIIVEGLDNNKIGESSLDVSPIINNFLKKGANQSDRILEINENMRIQVRIFVEKSKEQLTKSICSFSEASSVYRTKTEPNYPIKHSGTSHRDFVSKKNRNSNTRQTNEQPSYKNVQAEQQTQLQTSEKDKSGQEEEIKEGIQNTPQWDQDFDSISVIQSKQQTKNTIGKLSTKTVVTFIVMFLCLLSFFIIKIEDQKGQLSRITKITRRVLGRRETSL